MIVGMNRLGTGRRWHGRGIPLARGDEPKFASGTSWGT